MDLLHIGIWAIGLFGGAKMVETNLENFLMNQPWMPANLKKYVVPVVTAIGGIVASVYGGVAPADAFMAAIGFGGAVSVIHDHPDLTSSEIPLPPPPDLPDGVPGDAPVAAPPVVPAAK